MSKMKIKRGIALATLSGKSKDTSTCMADINVYARYVYKNGNVTYLDVVSSEIIDSVNPKSSDTFKFKDVESFRVKTTFDDGSKKYVIAEK